MPFGSAALILVNDCRTLAPRIQIRSRTKGEEVMFTKIAIAADAAPLFRIGQSASAGSAAACGYTQAYDTGPGAGLFGVTGTNFATAGTNVTVKICGRVPGGQDVPATGAYSDTVNVNVNF